MNFTPTSFRTDFRTACVKASDFAKCEKSERYNLSQQKSEKRASSRQTPLEHTRYIWGVDYVLLDRNKDLVGPGFCYRDARTNGMMKRVFESISQTELFEQTGVQFMEINTLYQLYSMRAENSPLLDVAEHFLMIPDFINWLLTGQMVMKQTKVSGVIVLGRKQRKGRVEGAVHMWGPFGVSDGLNLWQVPIQKMVTF